MYNQNILNELDNIRYLSNVSEKKREYFDTIYFSKEDYDMYKNNKFVLYINNKNEYINVIIKYLKK